MFKDTAKGEKIRASFSHMGLVVKDIGIMEDFYTNVIGFERTDGGMTGAGVVMIFMTLDPEEHHQVFLVEGRPDEMPTNTIVPGAGGGGRARRGSGGRRRQRRGKHTHALHTTYTHAHIQEKKNHFGW